MHFGYVSTIAFLYFFHFCLFFLAILQQNPTCINLKKLKADKCFKDPLSGLEQFRLAMWPLFTCVIGKSL